MRRLLVLAGVFCVVLTTARVNSQAAPPPSKNLSLLRDAAQALAAGDLPRAENELQLVLSSDPKEYRALNLLGIVRAQQHREAEAEKLFEQAIEINSEFAGAHVDLGLLYAQMNRADEAAAQFQEALRIDPSRTDARDSLVGVWRQQARGAVAAQDSEKALALLLRARKLAPQNPDVQFELGMVTLRMSLFSDSAAAFRQALAERKDDVKSLYGLGRAQVGMGKFQDAEQTFERYLQLRPDDASAHYALGFVLLSLQKNDDARRQFEKSIALQPEQTESYFQLGLMDLDENNLDSAVNRFQGVLAHDPKHAGALTGMGRAAFQRKDYKSAADFLQRAVAADPSLRQAHYYLGMAYGRTGQKEESDKELAIASQLEHQEVEKLHTGLRIEGFEDAAPAPR